MCREVIISDGLIHQQFCSAKDLLKQMPEQAESREQLREMLASRKSGGIIFTTIQKFSLEGAEDDHPVLCERTNVVVISDEAHRSQYGTKGRLDTKTGKYVYGYAKHMRDALPGASFIGFTGTPIEKGENELLVWTPSKRGAAIPNEQEFATALPAFSEQ